MKDKEYELVPHEEIEKLKRELRELREFEIAPTKKMEISILELNKKLDKLIDIFDKASHDLKRQEGGLTFTEKMKPLAEKMNRVLEQNAEIASGILAVADMIKPPERKMPSLPGQMPPPGIQPRAPHFPPRMPSQAYPQKPVMPSGIHIRTPQQPKSQLPAPPKKRTFGL